eukprot:TRINITY_DN48069_c0_g1_i1.p1 TRINITY_DN48069_c0_g1~~TRINITY_DN48069_c0_g1_i1.p1  ORF type:complete len:193 (+),score=38.61 TRINITY_DN48069_c0_g1_i1:43-579(+)
MNAKRVAEIMSDEVADFSDTQIDGDLLSTICRYTTWNTQVECLYLSGCGLDDDGVVAVCNAMSLSNIKEVYFTRNDGVSEKSVRYLTQIADKTNLSKAAFSKNIPSPVIDGLQAALKSNTFTRITPPKGFNPSLPDLEEAPYKPGPNWDMFTTPQSCLHLLKHQQKLARHFGAELRPV